MEAEACVFAPPLADPAELEPLVRCLERRTAVHSRRDFPRGTLLPDGRVLSDRAQQKVRSADQGVRYAAALLVGQGAEPPGSDDPAVLAAWLRRWPEASPVRTFERPQSRAGTATSKASSAASNAMMR